MHQIINSKNNEEIKFLRSLKTKKKRKANRFFLVEGLRSVSEAIKTNGAIKIFVTEKSHRLIDDRSQAEIFIVSDEVMESLSQTKTPPGVVALCGFLHKDTDELLSKGSRYAFLDNISDPGNVGTLIRTAHAAGLNALFISGNCADPYNPKTVRSTMGSIFRVQLAVEVETEGFIKKAADRNLEMVGLTADATISIYDQNLALPTVLFIGSEVNGLSETVRSSIRKFVKIPMVSGVDSLNAAVAGSIAMMEFQRIASLAAG